MPNCIRSRGFAAALAVVFLTFLQTAAFADTTGLVRGTVTAPAKVPVAGASVTLQGEGSTRSTTADAKGTFLFSGVPFGRYSVTARVTGQAPATQNVLVTTNGIANVTLEVGSLQRIGQTQTTTTRGPADQPVGVNTLTKADISVLPQNQSLDQLIETVPGIVRFSYNEPVAHGYHGLTYEIDGAPLPFATSSNFSEVIDPRTIDSLEVFTGAFPAEYGGYRQGAVVNIISHRATDLDTPDESRFSTGFGSYGEAQALFGTSLREGNTRVYFNGNLEQTDRGIDSPTFVPVHDSASQTNQFIRTITKINNQDVLAIDVSNNYSTFQIPINPTYNVNDPVISLPNTDDVQLENDSFANIAFTHNSKDGSAYYQIIPWYKYDRIRYEGDLQADIAGTLDGQPNTLSGLQQDRRSTFEGLRLVAFKAIANNAIKAGVDANIENFSGNEEILYYDGNGVLQPPFFDNSAQRGTLFDAYIQDKWTPTRYVSVFGGLRFDHSTGYVGGAQLSPRIEFDGQLDPKNIFHAYFGTLYAAPFLEDTRRAAVVVNGGSPNDLPVYDLQPEHDAYYEFGLAHTFSPEARGYVNLWKRYVRNILDTTQLANTPIFAVFNNTIGIADGAEARVDERWRNGDAAFLSASLSQALAGGINGGTFLFPPNSGQDDVTLQPEDHDQTFAATFNYTKRLGRDKSYYADLQPQYGFGYPVQFQNGPGRLPPHLIWNASVGRDVTRQSKPAIGFVAQFQNFTNTSYLLKVNNGFNTTQWGAGFQASFRLVFPF